MPLTNYQLQLNQQPINQSTHHTAFQLAKKYISYYLTASNGKGHGIHSPFVFEFIKYVLNDRTYYQIYEKAETVRKELLADKTEIDVEDFGAGSSIIKTKKRIVSRIAATSLKPKKYSRLLFRMVQYYKPQQVLELGTSFGVTTAYLASAPHKPSVTTMEGSETIAAIARQTFTKLNIDNINIITGDFEKTLSPFLENNKKTDLFFPDGNHRKLPTLKYFDRVLLSSHEDTIMVFDDIHWSEEMEGAWAEIKKHKAVTLTIDLFFIGIVFLKKDFKVKQHFTIRF